MSFLSTPSATVRVVVDEMVVGLVVSMRLRRVP
jgi:uncharacterized protein YqiB (DUF1249 family)